MTIDNANSSKLPKLIPPRVPWMVAPSTPLLELRASENQATVVRFAALFGLEGSQADESGDNTGWAQAKIVSPDSLHSATPGDRRAPYKAIKVTFRPGQCARMLPAFSGDEVIDESRYDWSAIVSRQKPDESFEEWSRRFDALWIATSLCPDPNFYEVESSPWIAEINGARYGLKHYLIGGHDTYIEVLARDFTWEVEGILEGW